MTVSEKFKESTKALNKVLSLQISPRDKIGLGYNHKYSSFITQEDVEKVKSWDDVSKDISRQQKNGKEINSSHCNSAHRPKMKKFRRHSNEKSHYKHKNQIFSKHTLYGYCHYCHKFGHKADDCRIKEEDEGIIRKEDTNISNGKILICFICHSIGHFAKHCNNSTCKYSYKTQKKGMEDENQGTNK